MWLFVYRLIAVLDQVEMRVERLRRDTVRIEEEKDSLLSTLDSVKHSELLADIAECKLMLLCKVLYFFIDFYMIVYLKSSVITMKANMYMEITDSKQLMHCFKIVLITLKESGLTLFYFVFSYP